MPGGAAFGPGSGPGAGSGRTSGAPRPLRGGPPGLGPVRAGAAAGARVKVFTSGAYDGPVPKLPEAARNPFASLADRYQPSAALVRRACLAALVMTVVIVVTGGAVRVTGSGLGCPTWPRCTEDSLTATREMGFHGAVEFGNRMLTYVLSAAVGAAILAARARSPWRRSLTRLGWAQFWLVMGNAVIGGVTVLTGLNPYTVSGHFLLATALLTVATVMWRRSREGDGPARPLVVPQVRRTVWALVAAASVLVTAGTIVTGAGKHAGDSSDVPRIPVDWQAVTRVHAASAYAVVALTLAVWALLRRTGAPDGPRARVRELLAVLLAQGAVGYAQYFTGVPEALVVVHMLGSCLVWIAVLRVLLALRERPADEAAGGGSLPSPGKSSASATGGRPAPAPGSPGVTTGV